jgi:hypothetical protein
MIYPLVRELAAEKIPVAVTCRVLGFSKQAFYAWNANPIPQRDWDDAHLINAAIDIHHDDPAFGYRFIADELRERGLPAGENRVARLCSQQRIWSINAREARPDPQGRSAGARRPGRPRVHRERAEPVVADRHHRAPHGTCRTTSWTGSAGELETSSGWRSSPGSSGPTTAGADNAASAD